MDQVLFHPGELAAHALAGFASGSPAIRDWMPDQHRMFFGLLPFLPIATIDSDGAPVATILTGAPGFVGSPDPNKLEIAARPDRDDPAGEFFVPGAPVGILGIDPATRRRNRASGVLASIGDDRMTVRVTQSFGNCPQYIQTRFWQGGPSEPGRAERFTGLDAGAAALIAGADTFFVASSSGGGAGAMGGVDISHRGGRAGFVAVEGDTLTIPDFRGNRYFNTFGNLLLEPRTALLFVDWTSGTLVQVQGRAEILWNDTLGFAGAERLWRVRVSGGWRRLGAIPLRWSFGDFAPGTRRTGTWAA
jgi:predicted pyridoxine 5'-phosphate oxidase superfamily flavin-nucleotide-binding protein